MEPFGPENMKPVFLARGVTARDVRLLGNDGTHLKFKVTAPNMPEQDLDAIAFGQADHLEMVVGNQPFSMLFTIEENHWNGRVKLQLNVKDIKPGTENLLVNEPAPDMESTSA